MDELSTRDLAALLAEEQQARATRQKSRVPLFVSLEGEVAESVAHLCTANYYALDQRDLPVDSYPDGQGWDCKQMSGAEAVQLPLLGE